MSDFVVVDASLAFKWLVEEEYSDVAHAILQVWDRQGIGLAAPHLMPFEVTNALHRRVVRASQLRQGAAYDAHYMVLAENLGCDLWTADRRFHRAVEAAGHVHWLGEWAAQG